MVTREHITKVNLFLTQDTSQPKAKYNISFHTSTRVFMFRADELGSTTFKCWTLNTVISSPVCRIGKGLVALETVSKEKIKCRLGNQHATLRQVLNCTQRQARELISGPSPASKTRLLLSFNRTQLRVFTGRFTRHSTLRRHLYTIALTDNPLCRRYGEQKETSAHVFVSAKFW